MKWDVVQDLINMGIFSHKEHLDIHKEFLEAVQYGAAKKDLTVNQWEMVHNISAEDLEKYPNAKAAEEIRNSPLYKALL